MDLVSNIRSNPPRSYAAIMICILWCFVIEMFNYFIIKPSKPESVSRDYIANIQTGEYANALAYFINIPQSSIYTNNYIESVLKKYYEGASTISVKQVSGTSSPDIYDITIEIKDDSGTREEKICLHNTDTRLLGLKKEWRVAFPFKTRDIIIKGTEGSKIFIDGIEVGDIIGGSLKVRDIVYGKYNFSASIGSIAKCESYVDINEYTDYLTLMAKPSDEFTQKIYDLVYNFCKCWSDYCLNQDPDCIKPFLADRLFKEYTEDDGRFTGSKYILCQFAIEPLSLIAAGDNDVFYTADEIWHMKERITDPKLVFKDNNKSELEQKQHIRWKYHIINDSGVWKIDSAEQLSFKQEISK